MFDKKFNPTDPSVKDGSVCHYDKKPCIGAKCRLWITVRMHDQKGVLKDFPDCADRWTPELLIQNAKEINRVSAATESARNEARTNVQALASLVLRQPVSFDPEGKLTLIPVILETPQT